MKNRSNDVDNIVIGMEIRCCNDNSSKIRSRICAKRLVYNRQSPCPPYSHSPIQGNQGAVHVCVHNIEITLAARFLGVSWKARI